MIPSVKASHASAWAVCLLAALGGCTPSQQASQADKVAYGTLAAGQKVALGRTRSFDIEYRPLSATTQPGTIQVGQKAIRLGAEKPQPLTLAECLEIGYNDSRDFQARKETLYLSALALANGRRGWTFPKPNGALTGDISDSLTAKDGESTKSVSGQLNPSLAQYLLDGGKITLASTITAASNFLGSQYTTAGNLLEANITQPLLRGAWQGFAHETVYRQERDFVFAVFEYERFRQSFAAQIVRRYFDVLQQRDVLENEGANIERLRDTLALTKVLVDGGQVTRIQQDQAEQNLLNAQVRYEEDQQGYQDALDSFKLFMGLPLAASVDVDYPAELRGLTELGPQKVPFAEAQATEIALAVRADVLTERAKLRDATRDVDIAANAFLPQLDLKLGITAPGTPPQQFARVQFHRDTRTASASFNYALDQTDNRDAYRRALLRCSQARRDLEQFLDQVRLDVRRSYRSLVQSRHSYELQGQTVEIAGRNRRLASLLQKEGQASARDVLDAEEAYRSAQNGLTSALISYATTRLDFLAALGMLEVDERGQIHERIEPIRFDNLQKRYPYVGPK